MKRSDMRAGKKGLIIVADHNSDATPVNIRIVEVELLHNCNKSFNIVYDPVGNRNFCVKAKDLFYSRADARKRILSFLSKQHQKYMKGTVEK